MRRLIPLTIALSLFVLSVPLSAEEPVEPEVLQACDDVPEGVERVTLDGLTTGIDNPAIPVWGVTAIAGDVATTRDFILDLAGNPVTMTRTQVEVTMSWDIPVEDYDLDLLDEAGAELDHSENPQPLDGPEELVASSLGHCEGFTVAALNWIAAGASELVLDISVRT